MADLLKTLRDAEDIPAQIMQDLGLNANLMYIRNIIETLSDDNLGVSGTVRNVDVLIKPNPEVKEVNLNLVSQTNGYIQLGDYIAKISGNVLSSKLTGADFIVYQGMLFKVIDVSGLPSENLPIQWKVLLRKHVESNVVD